MLKVIVVGREDYLETVLAGDGEREMLLEIKTDHLYPIVTPPYHASYHPCNTHQAENKTFAIEHD